MKIKHCILLVVLLLGCARTEYYPVKQRVLLVYVGGDNDLSYEAGQKLEALRQGWSEKERYAVVVYVDRKGMKPCLLEFVPYSATYPSGWRTEEVYDEENSASPGVLTRVVETVKSRYPADGYNLLVFSHASGWLPEHSLTPASRSIITDGRTEMELKDFARALPDGAFDCIVFETCFMAGIEVAYELRHKTGYILASSAEILSPGFTACYRNGTDALFVANPQEFARQVYEQVMEYSVNDIRYSATYSVIRTSALEELAAFIRQACDPEKRRGIDPDEVQHFDRTEQHQFFDFEDYYKRLLRNEERSEELNRLVKNCVVWKAATPEFMNQEQGFGGFLIHNHCGLTTYMEQPQWPQLNAAYTQLDWYMDANAYR